MTEAPQAPREGLLEVGRVTKPHGLGGEVLLKMVSDRPERVAVGAVLTSAAGELTIVESRAHQDRRLVRFEGCDSRERADGLRGTLLWAEPIDDAEALWVHELIGCTVVDSRGVERGRVESVQENPAADLLILSGDVMVPSVFIVGSPVDGVVTVDVPDGLFDL